MAEYEGMQMINLGAMNQNNSQVINERIGAITFLADVWELLSDRFEEAALMNAGTVMGSQVDTA